MKSIKLPPRVNRVMSMTPEVLVGHYNLIQLKKSSLSSTMRKMVVKRVEYLKEKGQITQEGIDHFMEELMSNSDDMQNTK